MPSREIIQFESGDLLPPLALFIAGIYLLTHTDNAYARFRARGKCDQASLGLGRTWIGIAISCSLLMVSVIFQKTWLFIVALELVVIGIVTLLMPTNTSKAIVRACENYAPEKISLLLGWRCIGIAVVYVLLLVSDILQKTWLFIFAIGLLVGETVAESWIARSCRLE